MIVGMQGQCGLGTPFQEIATQQRREWEGDRPQLSTEWHPEYNPRQNSAWRLETGSPQVIPPPPLSISSVDPTPHTSIPNLTPLPSLPLVAAYTCAESSVNEVQHMPVHTKRNAVM